MTLRTAALIALLSCVAVLVALRRREPDRAVAWHWYEDDDGIQPSDPYPASLLP